MSIGSNKTVTYQIYYEDTDIAGVVYHANYLKYMERGRTEFLRSYGINLITLFKQGVQFAVIEVNIKFIKPASLNDEIIVNTKLEKLGGAKMIFEQSITNKEEPSQDLCKAEIVVGCLNGDYKPIRIPKDLKKELT